MRVVQLCGSKCTKLQFFRPSQNLFNRQQWINNVKYSKLLVSNSTSALLRERHSGFSLTALSFTYLVWARPNLSRNILNETFSDCQSVIFYMSDALLAPKLPCLRALIVLLMNVLTDWTACVTFSLLKSTEFEICCSICMESGCLQFVEILEISWNLIGPPGKFDVPLLCFAFYFVLLVQHKTVHVSGISAYCNDVILDLHTAVCVALFS